MIKFEFPYPNEDKGYSIFPQNLENNPNVLFHGTAFSNFNSIVNNGFKSAKKLENSEEQEVLLSSVSYAQKSSQCLAHVCQIRGSSQDHEFVVFAVKFNTLEQAGIRINNIDIHVFDPDIQPEIIGYCVVPPDYKFL